MKIESDSEMPPGGWRLTVPATGVPVHAPYAKTLFKRVNDHLAANGHPLLERPEFEDLACRESGHGLPWCSGGPRVVKPPTTLSRVKQFLRTATSLIKIRKIVDPEEHARRVKICERCPKSSIEGLGCKSCISEIRDLEHRVGKMPVGNTLVCTACPGCVVWAKAWLDNEVLDDAEKNSMPDYPSNCWRLR